ncbi:hypothetical protein [Mesorhizobium tamadayense]|uniref:hypothetical protein n=1 Tax=Mesorhizobium tamadayense TaxID=425306 RepID=UPI00142D37A9|nr:hypothetical protein [Mesorhizobium tamadayense]
MQRRRHRQRVGFVVVSLRMDDFTWKGGRFAVSFPRQSQDVPRGDDARQETRAYAYEDAAALRAEFEECGMPVRRQPHSAGLFVGKIFGETRGRLMRAGKRRGCRATGEMHGRDRQRDAERDEDDQDVMERRLLRRLAFL